MSRRHTITRPARTDQEIVDMANELAGEFSAMLGYVGPAGYRFDLATRRRERICWELACHAFEFIDGTDVANALAEIDEDPDPTLWPCELSV